MKAKIMEQSASDMKKMRAEEAKWRAEDDLRTLMAAKEIQKDKARMAAVRKVAREKLATLKAFDA